MGETDVSKSRAAKKLVGVGTKKSKFMAKAARKKEGLRKHTDRLMGVRYLNCNLGSMRSLVVIGVARDRRIE